MRKRRIAAWAITLTVTAAGLSAGEAAASAYTIPHTRIAASAYTIPHTRIALSSYNTGPFEITNKNSGKCLDVYNWSTQPGANIDQWTCGNKQANQEWYLIFNSWTGNTFWIKNENSGMCLEPQTNEVGAYIVQNPCNSNDPLQSWVVVPDVCGTGSYNPSYTYQNSVWPPGGAGLDVYGASTANHAWIDLWYMNWNTNQQWNTPPGWGPGPAC